MLLKSLFCLHGRDSRPRFVAISVGVYVCIALAAAAFGANFLMYLLALLGLPLLGLASLRRLADADKSKGLIGVFLLPLFIFIGLLTADVHIALIGLSLVLAAGLTFWGWRLPAPTIVDYRYGYFGPELDAPTSQAMPRRRVEPTIVPKAAAKEIETQDVAARQAAKSTAHIQAQLQVERHEPHVEQSHAQAISAAMASEPEVDLSAHVEPIAAESNVAEPIVASTMSAADAELEAQRQDELRFDALTRMTQNPADFVVPDSHADFRPANTSRVEQTNIDLVDVDVANVDLKHVDFNAAQLDPAERSTEPGWRFAAEEDDEPDSFNDQDHAEEVRQRRAEAKDSGSMTELFRGLFEFLAPLKRFFVLPKIKLPKLERRYWRPAGIGCGVVVLLALVWGLWPSGDAETGDGADVVTVNAIAPYAGERVTLALPDGFSVALEDDILIMRWLGEKGKAQNLWSLATAKGDKTCSLLSFNNGTDYRPVTVDLKADSATEARFTPLDTQAIIVDLARRGSISLCGYKFSLKGSQAILEQNRTFGDYIAR
ncbi:conserved hypothetical protein [Shewanella baltica OS195]|uniref:DUF805 domain-containing protein n=1 Tax=Shewanella baltica (strain OS195) TaxID=399599 RepID=A9KXX7_SHEB9|nr:hypothetical protein [Shewanella baltica]ABX47542.1 conserved hypothetical protein [Shewanella baltica OS195]ADT92568.1 hypothetical protein Sbal678_0368 [Shewanella baltica OS678]